MSSTSIYTDLETLGQIQEGDKIYYYNQQFWVDPPQYLQGVTRWFYNESRGHTVEALKVFVEQLFEYIDGISNRLSNRITASIVSSYYANHLFSPESMDPVTLKELGKIIEPMEKAKLGLQNLQKTYKGDTDMENSLELVIERLNVRLKKLRQLIPN